MCCPEQTFELGILSLDSLYYPQDETSCWSSVDKFIQCTFQIFKRLPRSERAVLNKHLSWVFYLLIHHTAQHLAGVELCK